jgi:deoxyribodipyrimidine photo-lyase
MNVPAVTRPRVLIYLIRHDARLSDNPIFHAASLCAAQIKDDSLLSDDTRGREDSLVPGEDGSAFTHLLPVYIFPAQQVEVSGFIPTGSDPCPYPEARSEVAGVWRTGPHRAKFMAQGVWDLKERLTDLGCGSGVEVRLGMVSDVVEHMLDWYEGDGGDSRRAEIAGIWMVGEEGSEENTDEAEVKRLADERGVDLKIWSDEKYYIDECVLSLAPLLKLLGSHQLTSF